MYIFDVCYSYYISKKYLLHNNQTQEMIEDQFFSNESNSQSHIVEEFENDKLDKL